MKKLEELTASEWAILHEVWRREPCAAPDVQEALHGKHRWAYSTVRTLMDRMVVKGLLAAEKVRNLTLYRSRVTQAQARRGEVRYALNHAFNGALTPMVECLLDTTKVDAAELDAIEQLIRDRRKRR